jgi:hypothetical protein
LLREQETGTGSSSRNFLTICTIGISCCINDRNMSTGGSCRNIRKQQQEAAAKATENNSRGSTCKGSREGQQQQYRNSICAQLCLPVYNKYIITYIYYMYNIRACRRFLSKCSLIHVNCVRVLCNATEKLFFFILDNTYSLRYGKDAVMLPVFLFP